ncbi:response regulator transcription factor [Halalkalibacter wakoensis]|nr:helix-turn-helix transcriptional regulator [Halalkalibacter wakoensis]
MEKIQQFLINYSVKIGLPLFLVNTNGRFINRGNDDSFSKYEELHNESSLFIEEVLKTGQTIKKPTVVTVYDGSCFENKRFGVTPLFSASEGEFCIVAGPIQTKDNGYELADLLEKLAMLFELVGFAAVGDKKAMTASKLIQSLTNFQKDLLEYDDVYHIVSTFFDQVIENTHVEFLAYASKNEDEKFVIEVVRGKDYQELKHKSFFIGEGMLGKVVVTGKRLHWRENGDLYQANYFHQFNLTPSEVFVFPLIVKDEVVRLYFGGGKKTDFCSTEVMNVLNMAAKILIEKEQVRQQNEKLLTVQGTTSRLMELLTITSKPYEYKHVVYLILDFFLSLNYGELVYFTSINKDQLIRGQKQDDLLMRYEKALEKWTDVKKHESIETIIDGPLVHQPIFRDNQLYGVLSVSFADRSSIEPMLEFLSIVQSMIQQSSLVHISEESKISSNLFDVLQESMKEFDETSYALTVKALKFVKRIGPELGFDSSTMECLVNVCKVMPYRFDFLKKLLPPSREFDLLHVLHQMEQNKTDKWSYDTKEQIIWYLYSHLLKKQEGQTLTILEPIILEKCEATYSFVFRNSPKSQRNQESIQLNVDDIEALSNLKSVIKKLPITQREQEILNLILEGLNNQEIADFLRISVHTVKNHVTSIYKKLNVTDRIQAMAKIYRIKYGQE